MLLLLVVVLCARVPCFSLHDASTIRLTSMSDALAPGKPQTVAGVANLTLRVMESPPCQQRQKRCVSQRDYQQDCQGMKTVSPSGKVTSKWATQPVACFSKPFHAAPVERTPPQLPVRLC